MSVIVIGDQHLKLVMSGDKRAIRINIPSQSNKLQAVCIINNKLRENQRFMMLLQQLHVKETRYNHYILNVDTSREALNIFSQANAEITSVPELFVFCNSVLRARVKFVNKIDELIQKLTVLYGRLGSESTAFRPPPRQPGNARIRGSNDIISHYRKSDSGGISNEMLKLQHDEDASFDPAFVKPHNAPWKKIISM